jgi:hypothetical protein
VSSAVRMTVVVIVAFVAALRVVAVIVACAVRVSGVTVIMGRVTFMPMRALRVVAVVVAFAVCMSAVAMAMTVRAVVMRMPVMFIEDLLRERVVLYKRLVMPMLMTAAIRTRLRLERRRRVLNMRAETLQHVFQHGIGFQFQLARAHFHRRVPIPQMIGGACQRNGIVGMHDQHILCSRNDTHEAAIVGDEHIAVAQHRAARQHQRYFLAVIQCCGEAALAAVIEGKGERRRALDQRRGQFRFDTFIDRTHENLRKGNSAAPSAKRLPARR